ncbi:RAMP superfamily CRISPR-associated protein [Tumebacillus algifaecis]|nr:RAMP superfamily CRISPR-associated protein [Tumebacillus algifaecis]
MFKELRNEAVFQFHLRTDSPFVVKSGSEDLLDPTLPDSQILRSYRKGKLEAVIPGSSLKGVFRSRAEQLLKTMGHHGIDTFRRIRKEKDDVIKDIYEKKSDPVQQLFGSTAIKSRILFQDAFPLEGTEVVTGLRHGVGIHRVTGGAADRVKFDTEIVESGVFQAEIRLTNYELWQLALVAWLLQDLDEGFIKIGSMTTRGFGRFLVENLQLKVRDYRINTSQLTGFQDKDVIGKALEWKASLLRKEAYFDSLEELIGDGGILLDVPFPAPKEARA